MAPSPIYQFCQKSMRLPFTGLGRRQSYIRVHNMTLRSTMITVGHAIRHDTILMIAILIFGPWESQLLLLLRRVLL